jgi:predicted SnoaL-like aldol condensation-catalyzing enzyme
MSEENKTIVRRWFEDFWNKGNLSVADEILAPTYTHHDPSTADFGRGPESEKKRATLYRTAFPDVRLNIDDMIAEGDRVAIRWTCRGTHKGDLNGIAPTG